MKKILLYPLSVIFYTCFIGIMFLFHPFQWLCLKIGGYKAHKISVDLLNLSLMSCLYVIGNRCSYHNTENLPNDKPLIIVSNHQSMFDIIAISWFLRKHHPKFISKVELGKGWPSVSFNLRNGGSVLIDRQNPRQSIPALGKFSKYVAYHKCSAVIFPEGTRSKTGELKPFSTTGLKILLKNIPEALVIPVTINNSWKLLMYGWFPVNTGVNLSLKIQEPLEVGSLPDDELIAVTEQRIKKDIV